MARMWCLTFYTEGAPYDGGVDLADTEREFRAVVSPYVDEYLACCPRQLRAECEDAVPVCADYSRWMARHPRRAQVTRYPERWARVGFLAWKPYICRRVVACDEVAAGDIVFYHDVDLNRYPQYRLYAHEWKEVAVALLDQLGCDLFAPFGKPLKYDTKAFLIRKYLGSQPEWFERRGVWAGLIVMRKSPLVTGFLEEWFALCSDLDNISPLPNPDPHPEFECHSGEQSVMAVLALQWRREGRLPSSWPRFTTVRRTFSWNSLVELGES